MKNTKRFMALLLALVLVFSSMTTAFAAVNEDVVDTEFEAVVGKLNAVGVMEGFPDGTFRPEDEITRAQFAAIAIRALGLGDAAEVSVANTVFTDVNAMHWAAGYINLAVDRGVIKGYPDGTYRPEAKLSNAEAITILVRLVGMGPVIDKQGTWPANYVSAANNEGILKGVNVASTTNSTRGIAAKMLANTLEVQKWGATGYDNDGSVTYGKLWDDDLKLTLLNDNLEIVELEDVMLYAIDDEEVELNGVDYDYVGVEVDEQELFLSLVDAWVNADDEVIYVVETSTTVLDAIEVDLGDDELTAVEADKDYDFFLDDDDDADVVVYENGDAIDLEDLNADYDYAKLVLNDKNDVVAISAYDWDNFIVVEEVDENDVFGYGDEFDAEDFTIVKEGKTIAVEDLMEGDILFYNNGAEYADVYNNAKSTGEMEEVFTTYFEVDGEEYDYFSNNFGGKSAQYLDEDGDIANFDSDAAEQMEDEEDEVTVFVDREGNAVYVMGNLGVAPKSTVGAVLHADAVGYTDVRDREYLEIKVVNEEGTVVTYDFNIEDLDDVTIDNTEYEVDSITTNASGAADPSYETITVTPVTGTNKVITLANHLVEGDVVELTFDEDGDLVGLGVYNASTVTFNLSDEVETGDKYIQAKRVASSVPVFVTEGVSFDDDEVTVEMYGDMDDDIALKVGTVFFNGNDASYIVVTDSDFDSTSTIDAVITQVRYESGSTTKIERVKALVNNVEETYYMEDVAADSNVVEGAAIQIVLYDANNRIKEFKTERQVNQATLETVVVRDREITTDVDTYELVSDGYIYDVTDPTDIEEMSLSELKDSKDGTAVAFLEDEATSNYVMFVLVDTSGVSTGGPVTTEGVVTYIDASGIEVDGEFYTFAAGTVLRNEVGVIEYTGGAAIGGFLQLDDQVFDITANADNRISSFKYVAATADKTAATTVIDLIDDLDPEAATYAADITAARTAFGTAGAGDGTVTDSVAKQNLVTNEAKLVAAEDSETFKTTHAAILAETVGTVAIGDQGALTTAVTAYNAETAASKALLADEKALMDALQAKIDELVAAQAQTDADAFTTTHAAILAETVDTVAVADQGAVTAADGAYVALSTEAQALVADEKDLLDDLQTRIDAIVAVNNVPAGAGNEAAMQAAIEDTDLGLDLTAYNQLIGAQKTLVIEALTAGGRAYTDTASVQAALDAQL